MAGDVPVIDAHMHLFDTGRPDGVPWPDKEDIILYRPALPDRYCHIAEPLGIRGAIVIEASPLLEDNDWLLDLAADCTIIVAVVGNIEPGTPEFGSHLERFVRNPVFRGIRFGTLWGRSLTQALSTRQVIADLKLLASAELELDVIGNDWTLLGDVVRLTDCVPDLRVVINHLPEIDPPTEPRFLDVYRANLQKLAQRPQVYAKLSALLRRQACVFFSWEGSMGKAVAFVAAVVAALILVGWVVSSLIGPLFYLLLGALVVGGGIYLYARAKKSLAPGTRTQRRIEAAAKTYRMRNR
ncbi:MAG TPA: amidohydrolase family protein [Bryobacteraceae bacterium]|nr:amidohydrolase family protein [Bryobacteraceae bacterium]